MSKANDGNVLNNSCHCEKLRQHPPRRIVAIYQIFSVG